MKRELIGGNDGLSTTQIETFGDDRGYRNGDSLDVLLRVVRRGREAEVDVQLVTPTPAPEVDEGYTAAVVAKGITEDRPWLEPRGTSQDAAASGTLWSTGRVDIRAVICSFDWPQGCEYWIGIAWCESGLRPSVHSSGGHYVGLFQVWLGHGYGYEWLLDPYNNTLAAWELSDGGINVSPWPYCRY